MIWSELGREYSGMYLQPLFYCGTTPQAFFSQNSISKKIRHGHFSKNKFSSKTRSLGHQFELISHKSCSYGPYGPFRFSEKHEIRYVNFHQNLTFLEKTIFSRLLGK